MSGSRRGSRVVYCDAVRISLVLAAAALLLPPAALAAGDLAHPSATPVGTFGGIDYIQYDGIFEGQSSTGAYRVPYRITAPADAKRGNRTVLVEPPHNLVGLGVLDLYLGREFLLARGFVHAGVGYSTTDLRILDPTVPDVFIDGGFDDQGGRTDDEIIVDFARALSVDPEAQSLLGRVDRRYVTGFSDSAVPVLRLVMSGQADGVFDLAFPITFPITAEKPDPQTALTDGRFDGKLVILNSEAEGVSANFVDAGVAPNQYRFYAVAGTPHIPDFLVPPFPPSSMTTPASFQPELRAHFVQGDDWVRQGKAPPPSTHLLTADDGVTLDRDANGNAITVDALGRRVPRLPFIELGEARFITGFLGSYDQVKTINDLGFASPSRYVKAFDKELKDYVKALGILKEDADAMRSRAALCSPLTYTETYRDHYEEFVAIDPCEN